MHKKKIKLTEEHVNIYTTDRSVFNVHKDENILLKPIFQQLLILHEFHLTEEKKKE